MKYFLILLFISNNVLGQEVETLQGTHDSLVRIMSNDFAEYGMGMYDYDRYVQMSIIGKDTVITVVGDSLHAIKLLFKAWDIILKSKRDTVYIPLDASPYDNSVETHIPIEVELDSALYYYRKQIHFEKLRDEEMTKVNGFKSPKLTRKAIQLTDSVEKFKLLLKSLKK